MNKKLTVLNAINGKGCFCTSSEIAELFEGEEDYEKMTEFDKKKSARAIITIADSLFRGGYLVKIKIPQMITCYGLPEWIQQGKPVVDNLPESTKIVKDKFIVCNKNK